MEQENLNKGTPPLQTAAAPEIQQPAPDVKPEAKKEPSKSAPKKELTPAQMQRRKKMLIMPLFFLIFGAAMWLIFAPSGKDKEKEAQQAGLNVELPMPKDGGLVSDKREAYQREAMQQKEQERMRSLQDFSYQLSEAEEKERQWNMAPKPAEDYEDPSRASSRRSSAIQSSTAAYQDINRQLGSWNDQPKVEPDQQVQAKLENRIHELERKQEEDALRKKTEDDQLAVIEKSYQLAAKYMPGTTIQGTSKPPVDAGKATSNISSDEKAVAQPVRQFKTNVVSFLGSSGNDSENAEYDSDLRNSGFRTVAENDKSTNKNSIRACINQTVTLTNGKELQLRLLEPIQVGDVLIPDNTLITGLCRIGGERLNVTVTSIQYAGNIIPVHLQVYGTDGQAGISVPGNDAVTAAKEVASSLASSSGSSIMISDNASSQLAADLGKGLIKGASQFVSKKMSTVRVTIKAGYQVLLLPKN
jgi:conjugative transposon TraM protein